MTTSFKNLNINLKLGVRNGHSMKQGVLCSTAGKYFHGGGDVPASYISLYCIFIVYGLYHHPTNNERWIRSLGKAGD